MKKLDLGPLVRGQVCICPNSELGTAMGTQPVATTMPRRLFSTVISAQGTAVAERCQERAPALNDLEDSHRMGSPLCRPHPPSPQGQPSTQDPWPRGAASFRAMVSVSSSPDSQLLPLLVLVSTTPGPSVPQMALHSAGLAATRVPQQPAEEGVGGNRLGFC